jgi:3-oxoacyl-[acyl-carrier-protein] synthase II
MLYAAAMSRIGIAVTGLGAITALGNGTNALWTGLLEGRRPFAPIRAFDPGACRVNLAAEVRHDFSQVSSSRTANLGVTAAREALLQAGAAPVRERIGLVVASTGYGDRSIELALAGKTPNGSWWRECLKGTLADELARILRLGPKRQVINTACSSGAIAIALACDGLRAFDYDVALAVGCDELAAVTYSGFHSLRALDPEPCRPFDKNRRGMSIGEGAGCLVLERANDARQNGKRILGFVAGSGFACDAHHLTAPDPEGKGAALSMQNALQQAGVLAKDIGFVNAHGTGTPLNDAAEIAGIERAFADQSQRCLVHSVKASTGHCMGAAGTLEAVVAILALENQMVPATAGLIDCEFDGHVDCVTGQARGINANFGMSNSFGFGGNDATLVFERGEAPS